MPEDIPGYNDGDRHPNPLLKFYIKCEHPICGRWCPEVRVKYCHIRRQWKDKEAERKAFLDMKKKQREERNGIRKSEGKH